VSIPFQCEACGARFEILPEHAGRKIKCGACGAVVTVPGHETIATGGETVRLPPMRAKPAAGEKPAVRSGAGVSPAEPAAAKPAPASAKRCPQCRAILRPGEPTCSDCGVDLTFVGLSLSESRPVSPAPAAAASAAVRRARGLGGSKIFWIASGAAGLIAVLGLIWILWGPRSGGADAKLAGATQDETKAGANAKTEGSKTSTPRPKPEWQSIEWKPQEPPKTPPPPTGNAQTSFAGWLQDPDAAKRKAAAEKKDILMLFDGSDWCGYSMRMSYEVFFQKEFREWADDRFVLMIVDFPKKPAAKAAVENAGRNDRLAREYEVDGFPAIILTDAEGRPYGELGYVDGGVQTFIRRAGLLESFRAQRDDLFYRVGLAKNEEKLAAARKALTLLREARVSRFYVEKLDEWLQLAEQYDADNGKGQLEFFFEARWLAGLGRAMRDGPAAVLKAVAALEEWKKKHPFQDADRAAGLHLFAARSLTLVDRNTEAAAQIQAGLACHPKNADLLATLKAGAAAIEGGEGGGTGFAISADGHLLTNFHVIEDAEQKLVVRVPGVKEPVPARVVAKDKKRDMALLKIAVPAGVTLQPLSLSAADAVRGAKVAAFGYPLSDTVGTTLKLTIGFISALPDESTDGMCVLDCRVNPGNSGGPLCDTRGHVVGLVTAKSGGGFGVDSYGMALPASTVRDFLAKHLPEAVKKTDADEGDPLEWEEVDRRVGPSVMMIVRQR
jgi:S1-C subfamily serine protease